MMATKLILNIPADQALADAFERERAEARQAELAARLQAHAERQAAWAEAMQLEAERTPEPARASLWRFVDWRSVVGGVVLAVIGIAVWVTTAG